MIRSPSERPAGPPRGRLGAESSHDAGTGYSLCRSAPRALPCMSMRLLLVTPPMIQLNTPYPATAYLMGFLRLHAADLGLELTQADASLTLFLRLFSAPLVARMANVLRLRARPGGKRAPVPP